MLTEKTSAGQGRACAVLPALGFALAAAVLAVLPAPAQAAVERCGPGTAARHETVIDSGQVITDTTRTKQELTALFRAGGARMTTTTGDWTTVGLTESSLEVRTATRTATRRAPGGGWCASLQDARVQIGYPTLTVYIPVDFVPGSCAYGVVRDHEMEHVAITRQVLQDHAPALDAAIAQAVAEVNPIWAPTEQAARKEASRRIHDRLRAPIEALKSDHRVRNMAIDSADNYQHLQSRCRTW